MVLTIGSIHCCVFIIIMLSDKQSIFVFRSMAFEGVGAFEIDKRTFITGINFYTAPTVKLESYQFQKEKKNLIHFASMFFLVFTPHTTFSFMILSLRKFNGIPMSYFFSSLFTMQMARWTLPHGN